MFANIYKSPELAPLCPLSPSPAILILVPLSTPGGIVMDIVFCFFNCPVPEHFIHGLRIDSPTPPQVEQVLSTVKKPDEDLTFP